MALQHRMNTRFRKNPLFRVATLGLATIFLSACANFSGAGARQWTAHGFFSADQSDEPELIGVFDNLSDCNTAADAWETSQVAAQPVSADCFPVDRR